MPPDLRTPMLDHNQISNTSKKRPSSLPCGNPLKLLSVQFKDSIPYCCHCCHHFLENLTNLTLDCNQLSTFQVVDLVHSDIVHDPEIPDLSFDSITYRLLFPNLSILSLERNFLATIPLHLRLLTHLGSLTPSHNPIVELPLEMGCVNVQALLVLKVDGVYIRNIPQNLLDRVPKHLITYLRSLLKKSRPYHRIKLMVVGAGDKGKTTLLLNLTRKGKVMRLKEVAMELSNRPLATISILPARSSHITSLLATKDLVYVGTGGGVIVVWNIVSMEVTSLLHGYDMAVRCLFFVSPGQQVRPFMRMFSRKDSATTSVGARSPKPSAASISSSVSNGARLSMSSLTSNPSIGDATVEDSRSILFIFGKGYRGVVGNSPNHPSAFNLPSETAAPTSLFCGWPSRFTPLATCCYGQQEAILRVPLPRIHSPA